MRTSCDRHSAFFCRIIGGIILLLASGCGWENKMWFQSPDGNSTIRIRQPFRRNEGGIQIILSHRGDDYSLYSNRTDTFLTFAHVYWASSNAVAVFTCGTPGLRLAYSVPDLRSLNFRDFEAAVRGDLRSKYRSALNELEGDPFEWACSFEGRQIFLDRYPGAAQH